MAGCRVMARGFCVSILVSFLVVMMGLTAGKKVVAGEDRNMNIEQVSTEQWNKMAKKTIFFGHQSVGYNILDGVKRVMEQNPLVNLKIVKITNPGDIDHSAKGILYHAEVGKNFNPRSKIDAFAELMDQGVGDKVDIAFLKFCFVDIGTQTNIEELFEYYRKTLAELKQKFPSTTFIHFTVPLLSEQVGFAKWKHRLKGIVKKVLGKNEFYENVNKFAFNEMIRSEYKGKEPVFDLAAVESTFPDGSRSTFTVSGKQIESMVPAYTNDGGHLSTKGQDIVATKLLSFLATLE